MSGSLSVITPPTKVGGGVPRRWELEIGTGGVWEAGMGSVTPIVRINGEIQLIQAEPLDETTLR